MDMMDPNTQRQVWDRVFSQPGEQPRNDLRPMLMAAMELAAAYRYLLGTLTGKQRERLRGLYEGELANIAALRGISILAGQGEEVLKLWSPAKEPGRKLLETCYHRTRRCMTDYMSRSAEPEFGMVFRKLSDREGEHCAALAEILGMK